MHIMDYYIIRRGKYIFSGNSKGKILIVDANTLAQKSCFRVTQTAAVNNAVKVKVVGENDTGDSKVRESYCAIKMLFSSMLHVKLSI